MTEVDSSEFDKWIRLNDDLTAPPKEGDDYESHTMEAMRRAFNFHLEKIEKLKSLMLLTDPVVSMEEVGDIQLRQWAEFVKFFPDEGENKKEMLK